MHSGDQLVVVLIGGVFILGNAASSHPCPLLHVQLHDGTCEKSWDGEKAIKPDNASVRTLLKMDPEDLEKLQAWAESIPEDEWREPPAKFSQGGSVLDYKQVALNFVIDRSTSYGKYLIYPCSREVHPWIESILLKVTSQYNYADSVPYVPGPGYLETSIPRLLLARLGPKSVQMAHSDTGGSSLIPHKLHIPLTDGGDSLLYTQAANGNQLQHRLPVGYAYEVNNIYVHKAANNGDRDRTHLLIEFMPWKSESEWTDLVAPVGQREFQRRKAEGYANPQLLNDKTKIPGAEPVKRDDYYYDEDDKPKKEL